jgi:hypothetical protein
MHIPGRHNRKETKGGRERQAPKETRDKGVPLRGGFNGKIVYWCLMRFSPKTIKEK